MKFTFFEGYAYHRDLHVLTHSFPTRRSSDLTETSFEQLALVETGDADEATALREIASRLEIRNSLPLYLLGQRFGVLVRSEEHTSELQSLMRISYAVFCLKKKK